MLRSAAGATSTIPGPRASRRADAEEEAIEELGRPVATGGPGSGRGPARRREYGANRWCHRDESHQVEQRALGVQPTLMTTRTPSAAASRTDVQRAGAGVAEPYGQRALAGLGVGRDVAQVVDHQQRAGERADADAARPARATVTARSATYVVPTVATRPKKTKTKTSPSPR